MNPDLSDVVTYSLSTSLVLLIDEFLENMIGGSWVHKFIEEIINIISLIKYKLIFLESKTRLISKTETILGLKGF